MPTNPSGLVNDGDTATIVCETDEANPTADVTWSVDGEELDGISETVTDTEITRSYNANRRTSTLLIVAGKQHHNKVYKCSIKTGDTIISEKAYTLTVKCELIYFILLLNSPSHILASYILKQHRNIIAFNMLDIFRST